MCAPQRGAVSTHTPHRLAEGSGLSAAARNTLKEEQGFLAGPLSPRVSASRVILLAGRRPGPREGERKKERKEKEKKKRLLSIQTQKQNVHCCKKKKLSFLKMSLSTQEPLKMLRCTCQACKWRCNEATEVITNNKTQNIHVKLSCDVNRHQKEKIGIIVFFS